MRLDLKLNKYTKVLILALIWILFYLLIITLDQRYEFLPWGDLKLYEKLASDFVNGKLPFIDFFFEYPPASIIAFLIPKLLSSDIETYRQLFQVLNFTLSFLTLTLAAETLYLFAQEKEKGVGIIQSGLFFILIQLVLTRYDVFPMFLTSLGIFLYLYGEKSKKGIFQTLSYITITIAGFIKLYPFLIFPVLIIKELKRKEIKICRRNIIISCLVAVPFVLVMLIGNEGLKWFLKYHGERGLEIESTYSSFLLFLNQIGILKDVDIIYSHASYGVSGNLANFFSRASLPLFIVSYGTTLAFLFKQNWQREVYKKTIISSLIVILLFILTNKVFSPQYILWLFPLVVLFAFIQETKRKKVILSLITVSTIFTVLIYPIFWEIFNKGNLSWTIVLLIRNCILLMLLALCFSSLSQGNTILEKKKQSSGEKTTLKLI